MKKTFLNCTIQDILWRDNLPCLSFDISDAEGNIHNISIQNYSAREQIEQLIDGSRERAILAYGMTDIDVFRLANKDFRIKWSPCEGTCFNFHVALSELQKLLCSTEN